MRVSRRKTIVGSLAALAVCASTIGPVTIASAANQWHGGHGGWHGGGGHWHGGGWGPAVGLGVLGGLAAGAIIGSQGYYGDGGYGYGYGYGGYGDGCVAYQPVYDAYGNYRGQRPVNVC